MTRWREAAIIAGMHAHHPQSEPAQLPDDAPGAERIRQQERERIARDLHDELGSQLAALGMALGQLRAALDEDDRPQAQAQADYASRLLDQASQGMHDVIDALHPPIAELGLAEALQWQCRQAGRETGLACRLQCAPDVAVDDAFMVVNLLRIVREASHNAWRHAGARQIQVRVRYAGAMLLLEIEDDGQGFDPATASGQGHGLRSMRQRAQWLGGQLHLDSAPGGPTVVRVSVPVAA